MNKCWIKYSSVSLILATSLVTALAQAEADQLILPAVDDLAEADTEDDAEAAHSPKAKINYLRQSPKTSVAPAATPETSLPRVSLALVLLGVLGAGALYAKRRKGGALLLKEHIRLHSLASLRLGPKAGVSLVSVGNEAILLGVTEHGITSLRSYGQDELGSLSVGPKTQSVASTDDSESTSEAFNALLLKASKKDALRSPHSRAPSRPAREADPGPSAQPVQPNPEPMPASGPSHSQPEELPLHLAQALGELPYQQQHPIASNVHPIAARPSYKAEDSFDEPDGQAEELKRRFAELGR